MADIVFLILLILHISFIVSWLGGAVLFISIINPSLAKISANSRKEFIIETLPRYIRFITSVSIGSLVFGVLLFVYVTSIATSLAPSGSGSPFIVAGAVFGLLGLIGALGVVVPAGNKMVKLLKQPPPSNESAGMGSDITRLQNRMRTGASAAVGVLSLALILMIVGASI